MFACVNAFSYLCSIDTETLRLMTHANQILMCTINFKIYYQLIT